MRTLLNLIWFIFGGFWLALGYFFFGIIACIFIITIPVGVASFRMASYALWPFGKTVVAKPSAGVGSALMNAVWFVIGGVWLAIANVKMIPITCFPFGKQIVDSDHIPAGTQPVYSM